MFKRIINGTTVELEECYYCGSKDIKLEDCGYSSFNIGTATCMGCGFQIKAGVNCITPESELAMKWNGEAQRVDDKINKLTEELNELTRAKQFYERRKEKENG